MSPGSRRSPLRVLLYVVMTLVLLVVAAGVGMAVFVRPDAWRPQIEAAVQKATGRSLKIGHIGLALSLTPTIRLTDVTLGNVQGGSAPEMLTVPSAEVQLSLLPLLHGNVDVAHVLLVDPKVLLERTRTGTPNWSFAAPSKAAAPAAAPSASGRPAGGVAGHLFVRSLGVRNATVTWRGSAAAPPAVFTIAALDASAASADAPIHFRLSGALSGRKVTLAGEVGALSGLLATTTARPWPVKLDLHAANIALSAQGTLALPSGKAPFSAKLHLAASNPQADVAGDVQVTLGARPDVQATLASKKLDADALLAALRGPAAPPAPAKAASAAPAGRLFGDTPLPFSLLKLADGTLHWQVAELQLEGQALRQVVLGAVLRDGKLTLDPFSAASAGGALHGNIGIEAAQAAPRVTLAVQAPALALAPLLAGTSLAGKVSGTLALAANLASAGGTPHLLAAHLGGTLDAGLSGGQIDTKLLSQTLAMVPQAVPLPTAALPQSGVTPIRCATLKAHASGGVAQIDTLGAEAGPAVVSGTGSVNLGAETLDVQLRPLLKVGPGVVVPVRVGGTLLAPSVRPEAVAAVNSVIKLFQGGKATAATSATSTSNVCGGASLPAATAPATGTTAPKVQIPATVPQPAQLPGVLRGLLGK